MAKKTTERPDPIHHYLADQLVRARAMLRMFAVDEPGRGLASAKVKILEELLVEHAGDTTSSGSGIVPTVRYDFVLTEIGYQADIYSFGFRDHSSCHSFGGHYATESEQTELVNDLNARIGEAVREWRKNH